MYFDVLILEDVNHTMILCVFDRMEKQHGKLLSDGIRKMLQMQSGHSL